MLLSILFMFIDIIELGRSRRLMVPQRVDALESQSVVSVACGDKHTACTTDSGMFLYPISYSIV